MLNLIKKKFDVIIIGAGLSGLTLANKISEKSKKSVLIIEKKKNLTTIKIGVSGIHQKISLQKGMILPGIL